MGVLRVIRGTLSMSVSSSLRRGAVILRYRGISIDRAKPLGREEGGREGEREREGKERGLVAIFSIDLGQYARAHYDLRLRLNSPSKTSNACLKTLPEPRT